jgi:hypothetical protein
MGKFTSIAAFAVSAAVIRTHLTGVLKPKGVTAACLFARMSERAICPVVTPATCASPDFELIHSEMVGGIWILVGKHVGGGGLWSAGE